MQAQNITDARTASIPPSPEVLVRQVRELDATLIQEITATRRELEPLVAQVLPLLERIIPLHDRLYAIADRLAPDHLGEADVAMTDRLERVTGIGELHEVFPTLAAAFPPGTTEL